MASTALHNDEAKHHPRFYIPSGDIVIQVEKTIFKIHSHFLTTQSEVFSDMFATPQKEGSNDGTNSKPLLLPGDQVESWELFLKAIYREDHFSSLIYTGKESISVLRIAHKYCMRSFENGLISRLKQGNGTNGFLNLMIASQIMGSTELYETALQGLIASDLKPTLEEAKAIGLDAYYAIMSQPGLPSRSKCDNCHRDQLESPPLDEDWWNSLNTGKTVSKKGVRRAGK